MYKDNKNKEEAQNFWISYADLMAGLLFVFILLVGAIVIKYVFIQSDLQAIRSDLQKEKEALGLSESALADKKRRLQKIKDELRAARQENLHLSFELTNAQKMVSNISKDLNESQKVRATLNEYIATKIEQIALKTDEIQKLKDLLFEYELKEKTLKDKNLELQATIDKNEHTISLKDEELAQLENTLIVKSKEHQMVVDELNITKVKIKNLTGIRIKAVKKLREKLGDSIDIDPQSGSVRFSSNILFEQNSYTLKDDAKKGLSFVLNEYINALLLDKQIRGYIDKIVIEGHTNSDGSYIYNMQLSQKRALEVMRFLYERYPKNAELFRKYISASGRSYSDLIYDKNGKEDKDASRRIEIKFRIKNEQAIKELKNFMG